MDSTYEQLAERNAVLEAEKARLLDEVDRLERENAELRVQIRTARCA